MTDDDRRRILDRANRMLEQSRTLRKISDELLQESRDIRASAKRTRGTKQPNSRNRKHR